MYIRQILITIFPIPKNEFEASSFISPSFNNYSLYSNLPSFPTDRKNPLDLSIEILRKIAEFKRLREELLSTSMRQSYRRFDGYSPEASKAISLRPRSGIQDLEVLTYISG